jgi:hypothetical protein
MLPPEATESNRVALISSRRSSTRASAKGSAASSTRRPSRTLCKKESPLRDCETRPSLPNMTAAWLRLLDLASFALKFRAEAKQTGARRVFGSIQNLREDDAAAVGS